MSSPLSAITIFLGSFLIFCIQPMLGRTLLPSFGGTAAVWTVCLATFQILLLAGYYYAHAIFKRGETTRTQLIHAARTHLVLMSAAVIWTALFAVNRNSLKGFIGRTSEPVLEVVVCVLAMVGVPYVLLSANSTLIQAWRSREILSGKGASSGLEEKTAAQNQMRTPVVYSLYAVSNAGSLAGLLAYPVLMEPFFSLSAQWWGFTVGFGVYAVLLAVFAKRVIAAAAEPCEVKPAPDGGAHEASREDVLLWLLLPASSTFLLNAVTTHLSTEVTPIPLLWVVLLSIFLISYIVGFSAFAERIRAPACVATVIPLLGCALTTHAMGEKGYLPNLIGGCLLLLIGCSFLHSWLYGLRPGAAKLSSFYLCMALGGAIGGALSGIVAPCVSSAVYEYPLGLLLLGAAVMYYSNKLMPTKSIRLVQCATAIALYFGLAALFSRDTQVMWRGRNFYGCVTVRAEKSVTPFGDPILAYTLSHGETLHGMQYQPHYLRDKPTVYYGPYGGGFAIQNHPAYASGAPMSVGLIGLGVGTLACYGRKGDHYRFFEINPSVVDVASNTQYFTYLSASAADVSVALGDARKELAKEKSTYDVLVLDAFSGDSVPSHLATREAFNVYFDHLNTNGVLAIHITNWHMDLLPLCKAVGKAWNIPCYGVLSSPAQTYTGALWVFMTRLKLPMRGQPFRETEWKLVKDMALPTDECGSLISLIQFTTKIPLKSEETNGEELLR